jgi:hypothetical protein
MRQICSSVILFGLISVISGCGGSGPVLLKAKGKVVKGGDAFIPLDEDIRVQLSFVPVSDDGTPPRNWYIAKVDQNTGTFSTDGAHALGMPPGKYRAVVELKRDRKDTLNGKFDVLHSPFVFHIDGKSGEIVIDLDTEPNGGVIADSNAETQTPN